MDALAPRADTSCTGSKQWYVCSAGNFRGCCASDPCTSGICFDDNVSLLHLTSAASSTSSTSSSSSTNTIIKTSTVTIPTSSSTTSSTTVSNTSSSSSTTTSVLSESSPAVANIMKHSSSTATTTAMSGVAAASTDSQSSSKGLIIGGVIGVLIVLALVIMLLWFCRRRKRHGKSYIIHTRRSPSTKSLHNREMASVSKTELALLETDSTNLRNESNNSCETASPPTNSTTHSTLSTPGSTTALSLGASTVSPDPSKYSTLSSGILSTSSGGFVRLPPLRMPSPQPNTEMEASILKTELQTAAELSDTGFYRQRAELAAHSQSELINVPLERRRRKSPLNLGSSSSSSSGSSESSPRSALDKNGSSPLMSRHTARRVVTRDGVVMGANLDRYSTVRDPERGEAKGEKKSDPGQEHVMSFMTFGGSEFEMMQRRGPGLGNGGSVESNKREGGSVSSESRSVPGIVLEGVDASPIGEAPPAYDARGVASPKQDDKSPSGTIGLGIHRRG